MLSSFCIDPLSYSTNLIYRSIYWRGCIKCFDSKFLLVLHKRVKVFFLYLFNLYCGLCIYGSCPYFSLPNVTFALASSILAPEISSGSGQLSFANVRLSSFFCKKWCPVFVNYIEIKHFR